MLPLIQKEAGAKYGWITESELLDITAVSESTPGPIAVNTATFVGWRIAGFWGGFFATIGVVLPSFLIILALSAVLSQFESLQLVKYAFFGIRAGVLTLILETLWSMAKHCGKNLFSVAVGGGAFACAIFGLPVPLVLLAAGLFGLALTFCDKRRKRP